MAWVAVNKDGAEFIYDDYVRLPKGYIKKLIGKGLSWEDEPVELEGE